MEEHQEQVGEPAQEAGVMPEPMPTAPRPSHGWGTTPNQVAGSESILVTQVNVSGPSS